MLDCLPVSTHHNRDRQSLSANDMNDSDGGGFGAVERFEAGPWL
jgi:hypothetical protein